MTGLYRCIGRGGDWRLATGRLDTGDWAAGYWQLAAGGWLLDTGGWLLATGGWLLAAGGWRIIN